MHRNVNARDEDPTVKDEQNFDGGKNELERRKDLSIPRYFKRQGPQI